MRVLLAATFIALSSLGFAQVEPPAADLLQEAVEAHGGEALRQLSTYQDEGVLIYYDPAGVVMSEMAYRSVIDFAGPSMRMEMLAGPTVAILQQVTPEGGFAYAFPDGEIPMSQAQVDELRSAFDAGLYGLRQGIEGIDSARYLGEQEWEGVSGRAVEVVRGDNTVTYLFDEDGTLLADRYATSQLGETTNVYTELREVDGVLVPVAYDSHALGMKVLGARIEEVRLNESLAADAFSLEGYRTSSEGDSEAMPEVLTWLGANVAPLAALDPGAPWDDLVALGELVGDARVVAFGEQTHGTSEFFRMKHRALEYLVEEHGFTLFAIEANMPEAERLNRYVLTGEGDPAELLAGLYFWTWNTQEVLDMIEWMRDRNETADEPVQFTGFDMQYPPVAASNVVTFLEEHDPELLGTYRDSLEQVAATDPYEEADAAVLTELQASLEALADEMTSRAAKHAEVAGEEAAAWALQDLRVAIQALGVSSGGVVWRDAAMAENVLWLLERNPGARMLIWAHNGHVARQDGWMGAHLDAALGDDYLPVAFSFGSGEYTAVDPQTGEVKTNLAGPAAEGSVDHLLAQVGQGAFLLDLRDVEGSPAEAWFKERRPFRSIGAIALPDGATFAPTIVGNDFDAVIFIRDTTASQRLE